VIDAGYKFNSRFRSGITKNHAGRHVVDSIIDCVRGDIWRDKTSSTCFLIPIPKRSTILRPTHRVVLPSPVCDAEVQQKLDQRVEPCGVACLGAGPGIPPWQRGSCTERAVAEASQSGLDAKRGEHACPSCVTARRRGDEERCRQAKGTELADWKFRKRCRDGVKARLACFAWGPCDAQGTSSMHLRSARVLGSWYSMPS